MPLFSNSLFVLETGIINKETFCKANLCGKQAGGKVIESISIFKPNAYFDSYAKKINAIWHLSKKYLTIIGNGLVAATKQ